MTETIDQEQVSAEQAEAIAAAERELQALRRDWARDLFGVVLQVLLALMLTGATMFTVTASLQAAGVMEDPVVVAIQKGCGK